MNVSGRVNKHESPSANARAVKYVNVDDVIFELNCDLLNTKSIKEFETIPIPQIQGNMYKYPTSSTYDVHTS